MSKHLLVIGGGAAGLGAAWELRKQGARVTLVESNPDLGGRGRTYFWEGGWRIWGAAAYAPGEPDMIGLAEELGMADDPSIQRIPEEAIYDTMHPSLGRVEIAFKLSTLMLSRLIPFWQKLKLAGALPTLIKAGRLARDEEPGSLAQFDTISACAFFRRYSPALVDYIIEPMLQQYCGYGEDDYSLAWMLWSMSSADMGGELPWRYAERGVGQLFHELQTRLAADASCTLALDTQALELKYHGTGVSLRCASGERAWTEEADGAVVAIPGTLVNGLIPDLDASRKAFFNRVEYISHHVMHFKVARPEAVLPTSVLLPTAMGFKRVSNVWVHDHDARFIRIHAEMKGAFGAESADWDDDRILDACWAEVIKVHPVLSGTIVANRILLRNAIGLCRRHVGYTKALGDFRAMAPLPRVGFAGDYIANSTLGRSYRSGVAAAREQIKHA
jgi:protoporphyrinogen/coproporphyrinogen III oxidase